jgi:hypothetical protein
MRMVPQAVSRQQIQGDHRRLTQWGIAHLAALLRAPFLTSSFGVSFARAKSDPDDLAAYQEFGRRLAEPILQSRSGEEFEVINHYDPLHDRNLVKYVNRLRIKLWELPQAYQEFILRNLAPQGKIILVSCNYRWLQYVLGERFFLQIGGLGGISPQEYLERWNLDLPLQERRESEWGCPEGFASSVREFAARRGIELVELGFAHPQEYSLLAYRAYLECEGVRKEVVFLDSFNHQNPRTNIQTGIPGLWLPFNTEDSLAFAREFLDLEGKRFKKIYLTVLPSFARSPDTPIAGPLASSPIRPREGRGQARALGDLLSSFPGRYPGPVPPSGPTGEAPPKISASQASRAGPFNPGEAVELKGFSRPCEQEVLPSGPSRERERGDAEPRGIMTRPLAAGYWRL